MKFGQEDADVESMANADRNDYQLVDLDRRLQRRVGWSVTCGLLAVFTPIVMVGVLLDVEAAGRRFVIACFVFMALAIGVAWLVFSSVSAEERSQIAAASSRRLPPLPHIEGATTIDLVPGRFARRRAGEHTQLVVDACGVSVPIWVLQWAPRSLRRSAKSMVTIGWDDVARWCVRSDTDGADTYDIELARPWFQTDKRCWPPLRITRSVITDEVAMLDAVRSVGQLSIVLETSIDSGSRHSAG